jgi:hypothetical protein
LTSAERGVHAVGAAATADASARVNASLNRRAS